MRRVFITGAAGFMGAALAERYRDLGWETTGIDLEAGREHGVFRGDTREPDSWRSLLEGCDLVVHTAAVVSFEGDRRRFWEVNVLGTRRVVEAAVRAGVPRLVHISSVAAFGFDFPDGVDERWPVRTNGCPYVDTKVAGEQVVLQAHAANELDCVVVRPGDVYGPRSRPWTILPIEAIKAKRLVLPANGKGVFNPVYIDNLVDGIVVAAAAPAASGQVFTMTDGTGVTTREFFGRYCEMLGVRRPFGVPTSVARVLAKAVARVDRVRRVSGEINPTTVDYLARRGAYSIAKARRVLGWEPRVGLDEGMAATRAWLAAEGMLS